MAQISDMYAGDADDRDSRRYSTNWKRGNTGSFVYVGPSSSKAPLCNRPTYRELTIDCLRSHKLFEDPDFPADNSSLQPNGVFSLEVKWLRPGEIAAQYGKEPVFLMEGKNKFDVKGGPAGNSRLLATLAGLIIHPDLMNQVIPPDQGFLKDYAGIFHFNFWHLGTWIEVIVDDRLPTSNGKLLYLHSATSNEFWSALLEKAYAKMCGNYDALVDGACDEAFEDLTGGLVEPVKLGKAAPKNLLKIMLHAWERQTIMTCTVNANPPATLDVPSTFLTEDLVYILTNIKAVNLASHGIITFIRLQNPTGNSVEWEGKWCDRSEEWSLVPEKTKKEMLTDGEGEFWINFKDFVSTFVSLDLCHHSVECLGTKKKWIMFEAEGKWKKSVSAGGCRNDLDTFWMNPQYHLEILHSDDESEFSTVIVALMQTRPARKYSQERKLFNIGCALYALKQPPSDRLNRSFFMRHKMISRSEFINSREVSVRFELPKGHYLVVPSTLSPGEESDFLLRMYSEKAIATREIDEETNARPVPIERPASSESDVDVFGGRMEQSCTEFFKKIAERNMEVDYLELQVILNSWFREGMQFKFEGFSNDTCRSLVASKDTDDSGKLGFEDFCLLLKDIGVWMGVFRKLDVSREGRFDGLQARTALKNLGFKVSNQTLNAIVTRFEYKNGMIYFDEFIHLAARLSTMFNIYDLKSSLSSHGTSAKFTLDAFIQASMRT